MLIDGNGDFGEPIPLLHQFNKLRRGKEFDPVLWRAAQRLEQFGGDQYRHVMKLAAEQPGDLLAIQPSGRMSKQSQKLLLHIFHMTNISNSETFAYRSLPDVAVPPIASTKPVQNSSSSHPRDGRAALRTAPPVPWDP
jgi:hypothetical protein